MKTQEKIIIYQVFTRLFGNGKPSLQNQWLFGRERLRKNG